MISAFENLVQKNRLCKSESGFRWSYVTCEVVGCSGLMRSWFAGGWAFPSAGSSSCAVRRRVRRDVLDFFPCLGSSNLSPVRLLKIIVGTEAVWELATRIGAVGDVRA